ncbi:putative nuclease HARBI1 [Labrus mixtus]|uniref:putative nuclease HARBI1 n=1 Tax=Labrus mixtus TaxID=508554 RepID=UPI0029C0E234|nr:putative nuclease HARBI1 [Labrus mixtus]
MPSAERLAALMGHTLESSHLQQTKKTTLTGSSCIQLQVVCDHKGRFLNTYTGLPGSVHDARVLRWSSLYVHQLYPPHGWCIVGDGGYPCLAAPISLMTPFREPVQNPVHARYNRHHAKARCVVERTIGMMKTRWRSIFPKALEIKPTFVPAVVSYIHRQLYYYAKLTIAATFRLTVYITYA